MRRQRSGHILSISSGAGLAGFEFNSAYSAAKFGMEGWMEALQPEIEPFGITTTIVNPGFFRTDLLTRTPPPMRRRRSTTTPTGTPNGCSGTRA